MRVPNPAVNIHVFPKHVKDRLIQAQQVTIHDARFRALVIVDTQTGRVAYTSGQNIAPKGIHCDIPQVLAFASPTATTLSAEALAYTGQSPAVLLVVDTNGGYQVTPLVIETNPLGIDA